jgi:hypothetical protein
MQVKRYMMAAAVLALAACGDTESANPMASAEGGPERGPSLATAPVGARWSLYTGQTPTETLAASPGWEVGTRFSSSGRGKVVGFRFYRASGETGTNTARLWSENGQQLASATFPSGGTGWQTVYLPANSAVSLTVNTNYRVSVNTNTAQVKTGGGYVYNGSLTSGPLYSEGGYYGQPTGSMPTSYSASYFFVDVIFEDYVPVPDLYVAQVVAFGGTNWQGQEVINVTVCNRGDGAAAASTLRVHKWVALFSGGGYWAANSDWYTPALGVNGCVTIQPTVNSVRQATNDYQVMTDVTDVVYESNEGNNWGRALYSPS